MTPLRLILALLIFPTLSMAEAEKSEIRVSPEIQKLSKFTRLIMWGDNEKVVPKSIEDFTKQFEGNKNFTKSGNFYKVNGDFKVFGYKATYLGLVGYDMLIGPCAVVEAKPKDVIKKIEGLYNIKFKKNTGSVGGYIADYTNKMFIYIDSASEDRTKTVILGAPNQQT